jgi:general stress protein 26
MSELTIEKAGKIINSRSAKENMGVGVTLSLIDFDGYPTTSTLSISKAKGIEEITFGVALDSNKAKRVMKDNRASICLFDDDYENDLYYNITLVGDMFVITDPIIKRETWFEGLEEHFAGGMEDPNYCVLKFVTKRYNIWVNLEEDSLVGNI